MKKKIKFNIKELLNKKENLALVAMAVILCAGITVTNVKSGQIPLHDGDVLVDSQNLTQGENKKTEKPVAGVTATLEEQRANLELERNTLISNYDNTIKNSTNADEQKNAMEKKDKLTQYMEQEVSIEGMITAKSLPETMVIITDNLITVTVDEQDLKQNIVAKICNIVMEETGRTADKIIIQSAY